MKKIFKYGLFILIAVIAPFVIANEILRWTWFRNYPLKKITRWDAQLIHTLKPNFKGSLPIGVVTADAWQGKNAYWHMQTNSQQFRSMEEIKPRQPGVFRIICLGDSVTMGLEVDDQYTYPAQLQPIINWALNGRIKVEVINAGVWGYSSRQGLVYLDQRLLKYDPDLVILEFGINDSRSALLPHYPDKQIIKGDITNGWRKLYYSPLGAFSLIIYEQPLVVFIKNFMLVLDVADLMRKLEQMDKNKIPKQSGLEPGRYKNIRVPPKDFIENYMQFIILAKQKGFRLMFYIPYGNPAIFRYQVLGLAQEYKIPVKDFSGRFDSPNLQELVNNPVHKQLLTFYREKLGDEFLKKNPRYLVSTDNGIHLNAVGKRIVAEEMARTIISAFPSPINPAPAPKPAQP